jgi:UDP:flavonoid glycosyltransferase YjiC (YdhE family)
VGPVLGDEGGVEAAWNTHDAHVLAYLKPRDARFNAMVEALHAARVEALVAAPGLAPASAHALSGGLVRVVPEPLRLPPLLADAGLCVGHGGPGFAAASLLAGVPLAILPMHLEHDLVALRLHEQGLGVVLDATRGAASLREGIAAALSDAAMHQRARAIAARYEKASAPDAASEAAARLARLAA